MKKVFNNIISVIFYLVVDLVKVEREKKEIKQVTKIDSVANTVEKQVIKIDTKDTEENCNIHTY
jgi:hypothetical protein